MTLASTKPAMALKDPLLERLAPAPLGLVSLALTFGTNWPEPTGPELFAQLASGLHIRRVGCGEVFI